MWNQNKCGCQRDEMDTVYSPWDTVVYISCSLVLTGRVFSAQGWVCMHKKAMDSVPIKPIGFFVFIYKMIKLWSPKLYFPHLIGSSRLTWNGRTCLCLSCLVLLHWQALVGPIGFHSEYRKRGCSPLLANSKRSFCTEAWFILRLIWQGAKGGGESLKI